MLLRRLMQHVRDQNWPAFGIFTGTNRAVFAAIRDIDGTSHQ
jgi:hypothetical protein